ncbi:c-type cytochrome [Sedimentitalea todarodis]|uniref:C-type cytochrome n=1 Tax=Sedimentitalea todarodis TaxID=1631240 RepID=A0ABU3VK29_9RHOB|nr:c-type cytochrome [Sedimentitalea todarodis]MDU9006542.1 c-type cytochrome [Sedimentitalea todarodis]
MTADWVLAGGLMLACAGPAGAQDVLAGREKAQHCSLCHGELGLAVAPNAPNLAGENAAYVAAQLKAFRDGAREHHQMTIIASGLSDGDIADLAAWFAAISVKATAPDLD